MDILSKSYERELDSRNNRTVMCKSVLHNKKCYHGDKCRFAHTIDELNIKDCKLGSKCKYLKTCKFIHPKIETKEMYLNRIGVIKAPFREQKIPTDKEILKVYYEEFLPLLRDDQERKQNRKRKTETQDKNPKKRIIREMKREKQRQILENLNKEIAQEINREKKRKRKERQEQRRFKGDYIPDSKIVEQISISEDEGESDNEDVENKGIIKDTESFEDDYMDKQLRKKLQEKSIFGEYEPKKKHIRYIKPKKRKVALIKPKRKSRWDIMPEVQSKPKRKSRWDIMSVEPKPKRKSRWDIMSVEPKPKRKSRWDIMPVEPKPKRKSRWDTIPEIPQFQNPF